MRYLFILPLFAALIGCGGGDQVELVPVTGKVTINNEPADNAIVTFIALDKQSGAGGNGMTDATGTYKLTYIRGGQGIGAGEYKVVISRFLTPEGKSFTPTPEMAPIDSNATESIPPNYNDASQTVLKATVPAGSAQPINFNLEIPN